VPVQVRHEESSSLAQLKSLSRVGALIEARQSYAVGTAIGLTLELPGTGEETHLMGQILRVTPSAGGYEVAIHLAPVAPATAARIDSFVAARRTE
jgi:hypothetical protein